MVSAKATQPNSPLKSVHETKIYLNPEDSGLTYNASQMSLTIVDQQSNPPSTLGRIVSMKGKDITKRKSSVQEDELYLAEEKSELEDFNPKILNKQPSMRSTTIVDGKTSSPIKVVVEDGPVENNRPPAIGNSVSGKHNPKIHSRGSSFKKEISGRFVISKDDHDDGKFALIFC